MNEYTLNGKKFKVPDSLCEIRLKKACLCPSDKCLYPLNVGPEQNPKEKLILQLKAEVKMLKRKVRYLESLIEKE
jgi:hypothetical protein